jgi:hypothetical protein
VTARPTIAERFETFHEQNPHVYEELRRLAWRARAAGVRRLGIGRLYEVLRWETAIRTSGRDDYRLNNDYRARYARMLNREPGLEGLFLTRDAEADAA